jgi:hypothetical protein
MRFCGPIGTQTGSGRQEMKTHPDHGGHFQAISSGILAIGDIISVFSGTLESGRFTGFSWRDFEESGADTGPDFEGES